MKRPISSSIRRSCRGVVAVGISVAALSCVAAVAGAVSKSSTSSPHSKGPFVWRLQLAGPTAAAYGTTVTQFATNLERLTHGVVTLQPYYASGLQLNNDAMVTLVANGTVDVGFPATAADTIPALGDISLPGLIPSQSTLAKDEALREKVVLGLKNVLTKDFATKGVVYLGGFFESPMEVAMNFPATSLSQLNGKNIATLTTQVVPLIKVLGALPITSMNQTSWFTSLSTNLIQGALTNPSTLYGNKVYQAARYILNLDTSGGAAYFFVNKHDWTELSSTVQREVRGAFNSFFKKYWNYQYSSYTQDNHLMVDAGAKVTTLSVSGKKLFKAAVAKSIKIYEKNMNPEGRKMVQDIQALVKKYTRS